LEKGIENMSEIIEAADLPESEEVYLKKDWLGWRVVDPLRKDGVVDWKKFIIGSKRTWFQLAIYILILLLLYLGIKELIANYQEIAANPCNYCNFFG
jgi:hypothetical protein